MCALRNRCTVRCAYDLAALTRTRPLSSASNLVFLCFFSIFLSRYISCLSVPLFLSRISLCLFIILVSVTETMESVLCILKLLKVLRSSFWGNSLIPVYNHTPWGFLIREGSVCNPFLEASDISEATFSKEPLKNLFS